MLIVFMHIMLHFGIAHMADWVFKIIDLFCKLDLLICLNGTGSFLLERW